MREKRILLETKFGTSFIEIYVLISEDVKKILMLFVVIMHNSDALVSHWYRTLDG